MRPVSPTSEKLQKKQKKPHGTVFRCTVRLFFYAPERLFPVSYTHLGLIVERTALHDDLPAQLFGAGRTDDLVQCVLDDADRCV